MYYNEHSLSNQKRERKVKECVGFEPWFLMQVTRVFIGQSMNVAMTKAFRNGVILITVVLHIANFDARSIRALRFSKPAQLFWNIGVLRVDEPLSAHCLPIKNQNCQERRLQVEHFTPSIPDAKNRLRKHGCLQKGKFRYFKLKSRALFAFRFRSSPPFSLFLFSFLVLGIYWASFRHFRGKRFGELKTYGIRRKKVQVGSGGFSSPFSAQRFFFFLSFYPGMVWKSFYSYES